MKLYIYKITLLFLGFFWGYVVISVSSLIGNVAPAETISRWDALRILLLLGIVCFAAIETYLAWKQEIMLINTHNDQSL